MSFRLLPAARRDISSIALHISLENPNAARKWVAGVLERSRRLGEFPGTGVSVEYVRQGLRMFPFGKYVILFRQVGDDAEIVRVVHGARDWRKLVR
ncbi:toxin ParE1/3/4 [Neorhizobium sp. 2083]|uniref:type II toxin-antitoxin system RelE/ParE family toxin n=1 Tax=Neorhizobium sp. 2083 TaxID=2817762 RepID=UPI00285A032C|nr:type II toxin-antitoxin system RelE/ParE family toxin [Neorhizobium sp. 2083]MDR6818791.1 toxin ParE1/3/4 [Neorhizobium sp. 2083]